MRSWVRVLWVISMLWNMAQFFILFLIKLWLSTLWKPGREGGKLQFEGDQQIAANLHQPVRRHGGCGSCQTSSWLGAGHGLPSDVEDNQAVGVYHKVACKTGFPLI